MPGWLQPSAVMMTDNGRPFTTLRPVSAGGIAARRREHARWVSAGQDVVHIHTVAAAADHFAFLGQSRLLGEVSVL